MKHYQSASGLPRQFFNLREVFVMTKTQVVDNLIFVAALQQLTRIAAAIGMTDSELEGAKKDLERRLRPTIITPF